MIKANELMIGNWINVWDKPQKVTGELIYQLEANGNQTRIINPAIQIAIPIPITEEILIKAGAEKRKHRYDRYILGDIELEKFGGKYAVVIWSETAPDLTQYIGHCEYLHDLQNLIFELTKQELTINL